METVKNESDKRHPIQIIDAEPFMVSKKKAQEVNQVISVKPKKSEDSIFLDLNSVLLKFWKENDVKDREMRARLLERMAKWTRDAGTITLDFEGWHEEPRKK